MSCTLEFTEPMTVARNEIEWQVVVTNHELEGMVIEGRRGKPEERYLAVRLRTNWSHCVNLNAGPAVISPNIYKTCITQFPNSPNNVKKLPSLNLYHQSPFPKQCQKASNSALAVSKCHINWKCIKKERS